MKEIIDETLIQQRLILLKQKLIKFAEANEFEYDLTPISMKDVLAYESKYKLKLPSNFIALLTQIGPIGEPFLFYSALDLQKIPNKKKVASAKAQSIFNTINFVEDFIDGDLNYLLFYPEECDMGESLDYLRGSINLGNSEDDEAEIRLILNGDFAGHVFIDKYSYFGEGPVYFAGELLNILIKNFDFEAESMPIFG